MTNPESTPGDYDEVTRLRLELHQMTIQRDAFKVLAAKAVQELIKETLGNAVEDMRRDF